MKHFSIAISGFSGVGKDECASVLVKKFGAVQTGLADPAKRHMADLYGFSFEQLFGPSKFRNAGDLRYPKNVVAGQKFSKLNPTQWSLITSNNIILNNIDVKNYTTLVDGNNIQYLIEEGDPKFWLSPREALQLYCEQMNNLYLDTWIEKGIKIHSQLGEIHQEDENDIFMRYKYDRMKGVVLNDIRNGENWQKNRGYFISCFADFRHKHEVTALKRVKNMTPVLVRIKSKRVPVPPYQHRSELEQIGIPDTEFNFVLQNDGTVEEAYEKVEHMMGLILDSKWSQNDEVVYL